MQPIDVLTSHAAPLDISNIDTDQIIPKQFLKRIERTGYGSSCSLTGGAFRSRVQPRTRMKSR